MKHVLGFILSFIILSMLSGTRYTFVYGAIPQIERDALIALYNSTNGDNWNNNRSWKDGPLEADGFGSIGSEGCWLGITVDGDHVSAIDLFSNDLSGNIPAELGNLSNLEELYLADNQLTGSIPPELGNLSNLKELWLFNNQLMGSIPPELGELSSLQDLNLHSNQLTGSIPPELGNLSNLGWLNLYSNQLTGSIPPELGNLSNLGWLILYSNQLTGSIPPELGDLSFLFQLDLSSNQLTGSIPPELGNLSNLCTLCLYSNQLTGSIPPELGSLSNLLQLDLSSNQLTGSIPPELGNLSGLFFSIDLSSNQLTGSIPPELGDILFWNGELNLSSNQLTGSIPPELGKLSELERLDLSSNRLTGSIPPKLFDRLNIYWLNLASNGLKGEIPQNITTCALRYHESDFRWNGLYTDSINVRDFLNDRQFGGKWENTQTVAPKGVTARATSKTSVEVSWKLIAYIDNEGGYEVSYSKTPGGPYTPVGTTEAKYKFWMDITGLKPLTRYYFVVKTWTEAHKNNQNPVESEYSAEAVVTTPGSNKIISGRVATEKGEGIAGITLLFPPSNKFEITDSNGNYRHVVKYGWSGKVKPSSLQYEFTPPEHTFTSVTSDQTETNFTAMPIFLRISGRVTSAGEGIKDVTLTFSPDKGEPEITETDSEGFYEHQVIYGWTGKVTPSKGNIRFTPSQRLYQVPGVTEIRDRQDYELNVSLKLDVSREKDSTVIIRKDYGRINLNVSLKGDPLPVVHEFAIYRKESGGAYQLNKELTFQVLDNNQFIYEDKYLEKGKTYTYIAKALDENGNEIGESKEKTI